MTPIPHSTANQHYGAGVQVQNAIHAGNWQNKKHSEQKGTVLAQFYTTYKRGLFHLQTTHR